MTSSVDSWTACNLHLAATAEQERTPHHRRAGFGQGLGKLSRGQRPRLQWTPYGSGFLHNPAFSFVLDEDGGPLGHLSPEIAIDHP